MWYRVNCGNKTSLQPSIKDARWKAFEFLIQNKKDLVLIISKSNDTVIGTARYVNKKDKFGAKIGPVYWDARRNMYYLLDYDGSIFSTGEGIRKQSKSN